MSSYMGALTAGGSGGGRMAGGFVLDELTRCPSPFMGARMGARNESGHDEEGGVGGVPAAGGFVSTVSPGVPLRSWVPGPRTRSGGRA